MRWYPWTLGVLLLCCGDDPDGTSRAGDDATDSNGAPHFAVEGRGESAKMSVVLDVVEGQEATQLTITGADAADNLIVIYATFHGVESVVGSHVLPLGTIDAESFAVGMIDGRVYQSQRGELRSSLSSDMQSQGDFEVTLALDESSALPAGAPAPTAPAAPELTLAGTFESEWRVNCRSYISGFTGGHAVSDSPYCQALTF